MYSPSVLIISKRKELGIRYKKLLKLLSANVFLATNLSDGIFEIKKNEFEFIIVSDTVDGDIKGFVEKTRVLTFNFRPVIIAVSKSAEVSDKLELLNAGADDFLSETMSNKEFQARLNAHIRRHIENLCNPITGFLLEKVTRKTLKQLVETKKRASVVLISIDKLDYYKEIYGEIAADKVFQTLGAIVNSAISKEDTIGHIGQNSFILFTENILRAEKLAEFFAFAFDNVLKNFYSKRDYSNNFLMFSSNSKEERKTSLMKLTEAVFEYNNTGLNSAEDILSILFDMVKPLKNSEKSTYIIDRPKLYGHVDNTLKNKILIMENDEALGLLIETSCTINGFSAKVCNSYAAFEADLKTFKPDLIIMDYGRENGGISALDITKKHYLNENKKMPVVIFSTNILDKKNIMEHGADFYLPKPYDIQTLINVINDFLPK